MHAYCISLLRRHYHSADIDPNFTVLGEDAPDYQMRAVNKVLDNMFEKKDVDFLALCDTLGGRGGDNIQNIVLELYAFARSQPEYMALINEWTQQFDLDENKIMHSTWAEFLREAFLDNFKDMIVLGAEALKLCASGGGPASYIPAFESDIMYFNEALSLLKLGEFEKAKKIISESSFMTLPRKKQDDDDAIVEMCKSLRDGTKSLNKQMQSSVIMLPSDEIALRHKSMYRSLVALRDVIEEFDNEYKKIKKRRKQLDFEDLQHLALEALKNEVVQDDEKQKFDYIFVDEYQDTNRLQESIIEKIVSNNNLICVGDVKQSIYAFRQADPSLFLTRRHKSSENEGDANRLINLNQNFRSAPHVIDSINLIFDIVMSARLGQVDYDEKERLYQGAPRPDDDDNGSCELIILDEEDSAEDNMDMSVEREAYIAAKRIKELMGRPVWDGKKGIMRPLKYSDICILSKSFKPSVIKVRRVLEQMGIPVLPQESGEYFDEVEVGQTLDILTVIDNKRRDNSLISAMASPAFGFEIEELLDIRRAHKGKSPFYKCVIEYASGRGELGEKAKGFLDKIAYYKDLSAYLPLKDFIWQVLDETGLYNAVGALPGGAVRQGNLRLLLERSENYSKMPGASLHGFLSYISRLKDTNSSIGADINATDDAVKYMSIHKSKGLEFPVVIVINANKRPADQDVKKTVMTYKNLGYATKYYNPKTRERKNTLSAEAVSEAALKSVYSEEMRVYYVALTRAKEKLIVIGSTKKNDSMQKLADKWASPFIPSMYFGYDASLMNYIACAAMRNLPCGNLRNMASIPPETAANISGFTVQIIPAYSISIDRTKRAGAVAGAMKECSELKIQRDFLKLPRNDDSLVPAKVSATAIMQEIREEDEIVYETMKKPEFAGDDMVFSAAEKGTMTHKVLQQIDFECSDIKAFANKLEQRGILPKGAAEAMHYEWIEKFLESDVVRRAKQSSNVQKEVPFVVKRKASEIYGNINSDEDVLIQGIIDMCFIEDGRWILVDYKTNKVTESNTKENILNEYKGQLEIYKGALEDITGIGVAQAGLYLLSVSDTVWL